MHDTDYPPAVNTQQPSVDANQLIESFLPTVESHQILVESFEDPAEIATSTDLVSLDQAVETSTKVDPIPPGHAEAIVETGETFVETGETFVETGETFVETGETFVETGETFVEASETFAKTAETLVDNAEKTAESVAGDDVIDLSVKRSE
ncbi:hypothetical protein O0L34_g3290 [Tuta absoluta]|nr:hypothetical protein O0L34_g3290 [Tuta absoluta]